MRWNFFLKILEIHGDSFVGYCSKIEKELDLDVGFVGMKLLISWLWETVFIGYGIQCSLLWSCVEGGGWSCVEKGGWSCDLRRGMVMC